MPVWELVTRARRRLARLVRRHWPAGQRAVTSAAVDRYVIALLITCVVLALRGLAIPWVPVGYAVVPLVFTVAVTAYASGFGPAMLSLAVASVFLRLLFMGPRWSLYIEGFENRFFLSASVLGSVFVAMLFERMRKLTTALRAQKELLRRLIDVQEKEKQYLCNEFHDGLVQYAVGARMLLEGELCDRDAVVDPNTIEVVVDYLKRGIEDGRRALRGIRPSVLDDGDLSEAIGDLVDHFCSGGMSVRCACDASIGRVPEDLQTTVYRVVQEALNNARKHSGSKVVKVSLTKVDDELFVEVVDGGRGFDPRQPRREGFGLRGMTERVQLMGGTCVVDSRPEAGTRVFVRFPLKLASAPRPRPPKPAGNTQPMAKPGLLRILSRAR